MLSDAERAEYIRRAEADEIDFSTWNDVSDPVSFTIESTPEEVAALDREARRRGISRGRLVRSFISQGLAATL